MEKKNSKALRRMLLTFATLGSLFTLSGCVHEIRVAGNFVPPPQPKYAPVVQTTTYIKAQPLEITVPTVSNAVIVPVYNDCGWSHGWFRGWGRRGHGGFGGGFGGGFRPNGNNGNNGGDYYGNGNYGGSSVYVRPVTYRDYAPIYHGSSGAGRRLGETMNVR